MTTKVRIDNAGRVVLPKPLRDELELAGDDMRPVRDGVALQKERGVWVYRAGRPLAAATTDKTLRRIRKERHKENRKSKSR
jgi:AbrB family looped-hinge helix DNA binding protein